MTIAAQGPDMRSVAPSPATGVALTCAILLLGTAWHVVGYANTDIAWLLTVGGRILDGAVPYRDIIETNPPGSVLLYLPAVLIGRASGLDPQAIVMALTGLACAASLLACASSLRPVVPPSLGGSLAAAAAAVLILLPMGSFGQREHLILVASLPLLCRLASRSGAVAARGAALPAALASAAAGMGFAVKPYYALSLAGPALLLWRCGGWRALAGSVELWAAGAVASALLAAQLLLFPAFTHDILPLLVRIYLPQRHPLVELLLAQIGPVALATLIAAALARRLLPPRTLALAALADTAALASAGLLVAYLVQGKGWPYQAYPALAASFLSTAVTLLAPGLDRSAMQVWTVRGAVLALAGFGALWFDARVDIDVVAPGLVAAVARLGPHPRVMSVADDIAIGHPLVRRVGGVWVGTLMSRWIEYCVYAVSGALDREGPYAAELDFEAHTLASDILDRHPDAVLASAQSWDAWIAREPEVASALADYRPAGTYGIVTLWTRKTP